MELSQIIYCVSFILVCFGVGESVYEKLHLGKVGLLFFLGFEIILSFMPLIKINNWSLSLDGFILPLFVSVYFIFRIGSLFGLLRVSVSILLVVTSFMLYNVFNWEGYEFLLLQPYVVLALLVGVLVFLISKTATNCFLSIFSGLVIAEIIYYSTKFSSTGYAFYVLGEEIVVTFLAVSVICSLFSLFVYKKVKLLKRRKNRSRTQKA